MKRILQAVFLNDVCWKVISPVLWLAERAKASRKDYVETPRRIKMEEKIRSIFSSKTVLHGPFKGLNFFNYRVNADSVYAKLLGTYETEIHDFLEAAIRKNFPLVINIGCEDGYYAVGLALRLPASKVVAFDMNPVALEHSGELARQNNVSDRISFSGRCTADDILNLDPDQRMLLVVDCEGDEKKIFTRENAGRLIKADILIELHLHVHPLLVNYFTDLFGPTHFIKIISSTDDHIKALTYDLPELAGLDYQARRFITGERDIFMQWMYLESKEAGS